MLFDVVIIALMVISIYLGYKRGFIKTISKLLCFIVSVILAKLLHPFVSGFVRNSFIGDFINEKIAGKSETIITEDMPSFIKSAGDSTVNGITDVVVTIVTILLIMIVTFIAANLIINTLDLVAKLPFISTINRTCGLIAGLFMGILLTYLVLAVVAVANIDATWLEGSYAAEAMFKNNILMNLIF